MRIEHAYKPHWRGVPSRKRPENLRRVNDPDPRKALGPSTWYVYENEIDDYEREARDLGIRDMIDIQPRFKQGISNGRNQILEDAFERGLTCVMLDDDYRKSRFVIHYKARKADPGVESRIRDITLDTAVDLLMERGDRYPFDLMSAKINGQPLGFGYYISSWVGICSAILVKPSDIRFDPDLPHCEDLDFYLKHLKNDGGVTTCQDILIDFEYGTNPGGFKDLRSENLAKQVAEIFEPRWRGHAEPRPDKLFHYRVLHSVNKRAWVDWTTAVHRFKEYMSDSLYEELVSLAYDSPKPLSVSELILKLDK